MAQVVNNATRRVTLPDTFDIREKSGPNSKSAAISNREFEIYSKHKALFATFAIGSLLLLPLVPIIWASTCLIVRDQAKKDVANEIARKRIELLNDVLQNKLNVAKESDKYSDYAERLEQKHPLTKNEILQDFISDIKQSDNYNSHIGTYIKDKHIRMFASASYNVLAKKMPADATPRQKWSAYKKEYSRVIKENRRLRAQITKRFKIDENQLNAKLFTYIQTHSGAVISGEKDASRETEGRKKLIGKLSNEFDTNTELKEILKSETDLLLKIYRTKSKKTLKSIGEEQNKSLQARLIPFLEEYNKLEFSITKDHLKVYDITFRDAGKQPLPPYKVNGESKQESPDYHRLLVPDESDEEAEEISSGMVLGTDNVLYNKLQGDDEQQSALKELVKTKVLNGAIELWTDIIAKNPDMDEEGRKKLWIILQLSRGQTIRNALLPKLQEMSGLLDGSVGKGDNGDGQNSEIKKQNSAQKFNYDTKNNTLNITFMERMYFKDGATHAPMSHFIYVEMTVSVDLSTPEMTTKCEVQQLQAVPVSTSTFFDELDELKGDVIESIEQIFDDGGKGKGRL